MTAYQTSMHHDSPAASMSSEAAAFACAAVLLGSAVLAESIFVVIVSLILAAVWIIRNKTATAF